MEIKFGNLKREYYKYQKQYNQAAISTLESGWYILGEHVRLFEKDFGNWLGIRNAIAVNSGLDALVIAIKALGIGEGDEVIVPANTFIATVLAITENKAKPIFVEPDEYYNLDPKKIKSKITCKTKAIIVVHLYGQSAQMITISEIAKENKLFLIEDCAQSHGSKYADKVTGTYGDISCFSFYPTKNMGAFGDAGMIATNDDNLSLKIRALRNYGSNKKYYFDFVGYNSRMDEIQAALLSVKLSHYSEILKHRKMIGHKYLKGIVNRNILLPKIHPKSDHVFHLFVIQVENRENFIQYMQNNGIETQIHYPIPPHLSKCYTYLGYRLNDFPITEKYSNHVVSLPTYDWMTTEEIEYVIKVINDYEK